MWLNFSQDGLKNTPLWKKHLSQSHGSATPRTQRAPVSDWSPRFTEFIQVSPEIIPDRSGEKNNGTGIARLMASSSSQAPYGEEKRFLKLFT